MHPAEIPYQQDGLCNCPFNSLLRRLTSEYNHRLAAAINHYDRAVGMHPELTSAQEQGALLTILPQLITQIADLSPADRTQILNLIHGEQMRNFYSTQIQALIHGRECVTEGRDLEECW